MSSTVSFDRFQKGKRPRSVDDVPSAFPAKYGTLIPPVAKRDPRDTPIITASGFRSGGVVWQLPIEIIDSTWQ